jgi:hypothetical protein
MERVFKLISHQQVQQRSVNFTLPLNYNIVFEHRNSHTHLTLILKKRVQLFGRFTLLFHRKEGHVWRWDPAQHIDKGPCLCIT